MPVLRQVRDLARSQGRRQPDGLVLTPYDMRVLSLSTPNVYEWTGARQVEMARYMNDVTAALVSPRQFTPSRMPSGSSAGVGFSSFVTYWSFGSLVSVCAMSITLHGVL